MGRKYSSMRDNGGILNLTDKEGKRYSTVSPTKEVSFRVKNAAKVS